MTPVLSRTQMRAFDQAAIEACHVPGLILMENAGRGAADVAARMVPAGADVHVVCGTGNNGGDGFVVARHLMSRGLGATVWLVGDPLRVKGDARLNLVAWMGLGGRVRALEDEAVLPEFEQALAGGALVVDALFGTGLDRPLHGWFETVIGAINRASRRTLSLDLPSGLDADTGSVLGVGVRADATVTFGHHKLGLLTPQGARSAGRVHVVDLGVPASLVERVGHTAEIIEASSLESWFAARPATAHKHASGNVLVMAGSPGKIGAAMLVGTAALRAGAGLVTLASWPAVIDQMESRVTELMTTRLDPNAVEASVERAAQGKRVIVVGPGFGTDDFARRALDHLLTRVDGIKILDADALSLMVGRLEALAVARARGPVALTPHSGEAGRLLARTSAAVEQDRYGSVRELVTRSKATVVLKGAHSLVASPAASLVEAGPASAAPAADAAVGIHVNTTGNPALATAGAGDVLAGVLAALACSMPLPHAACAAVYAHGCAADRWRAEHGGVDRGLLSGELATHLPGVLAALARGEAALPI